jgi:tetratricopeptide (TPR) repeat protein
MQLRSLICAVGAVVTGAVVAPVLAQERQVPPMPVIVAPEARIPIEIRRVDVRAEIAGLQARTRIELEVLNRNGRELEGELQFPIGPRQAVTGFALDINGELRPAVPVEKAKGRQVFEDVTRTRVDPALLESTGGNNYKLRIYPLPAGGTRRVVLELAETLERAGEQRQASYQLPLAFLTKVEQLDVVVNVVGVKPGQVTASLGASKVDVSGRWAWRSGTEVRLSRRDHEQDGVLKVAVAADRDAAFVSTGDYRGAHYFYAELPAPALKAAVRPRPASVGIVWDASGSGANRDQSREFALMDAYFRRLADAPVRVTLVVVRDVAEPVKEFVVEKGDWQALRTHLKAQAFDGATNLGQMRAPVGVDLALLFTDGLGNGADPLPESTVPLYAINSAIRANASRLRSVAERSGGDYLDLARIDTARALNDLASVRPRLVELDADHAGELVAASAYAQDGYVSVAGVLKAPQSALNLEWQAADGKRTTQTVQISAKDDAATEGGLPLAALRWAGLSLQALEEEPARNRAAIRRLGTRFGLATGETSLIVLDAVEDYARHEIEPPASLLPQYRKILAATTREREQAKTRRMDNLVARFNQRIEWWEKDFPKDKPARKQAKAKREEIGYAESGIAVSQERRRSAPAPAVASGVLAFSNATRDEMAPEEKSDDSAAREHRSPTIHLQKWEPNAPYVARLKASSNPLLYAAYLDEKPSYTQSTAFFLDVADMLQARGQESLALRVVSNLAEMNLEDRHILRILAYRLLQAKRVDLALPVLERVRDLAPDEPQSWRDLALALDASGKHQAAIDHLWEVAVGQWNARFADIELTALIELNAILARMKASGATPDVSRLDARLVRDMPMDLRVVLGWDADNTDIDLWVIDPNGEKAFYGNQLSYQGGRVSRDFTGGYGPETYELRKAKPGSYTVKAQFYGHNQQIVAGATTLMLKLSTGFGRADQKEEMVTLRLSGQKDEVLVGTFEVK